jgi:mRNA interferase MazF
VWDVRFPAIGVHPGLVLSANAVNAQLGHVAAIPVTGTAGPQLSHLTLDADAGLTGYAESFADVTSLQPVSRARFRRRRGLVAPSELVHVEQQLRTYLGL